MLRFDNTFDYKLRIELLVAALAVDLTKGLNYPLMKDVFENKILWSDEDVTPYLDVHTLSQVWFFGNYVTEFPDRAMRISYNHWLRRNSSEKLPFNLSELIAVNSLEELYTWVLAQDQPDVVKLLLLNFGTVGLGKGMIFVKDLSKINELLAKGIKQPEDIKFSLWNVPQYN